MSAFTAIHGDVPRGNAQVSAACEDNPWLRGYVVIDPTDLRQAESELDRWLDGERFVGVKIHPTYAGVPIASSAMRAALTLVADRGTVALVHTWGTDVADLAELVATTSGLRAIAGHMGADRWDLAAECASQVDRLYLEPSCAVALHGQMRHVVDHAPLDQLLFGTDAPLLDPCVAFGQLAAADLTAEQLQAICWTNAAALFEL
ncbi:MAG: TatD family hydrolase [Propionibacteriaceae bacterium]|nr:TatD family hydrolase [Propionibacteriaceae bacterium]